MATDTTLPTELDFSEDRDASPERMNRAMRYLMGQLRVAQAQVKSYEVVIEELRALGLTRVADALTPVFVQAQETGEAIEAIYAGLESGNVLDGYYTQAQADALLAAKAPLALLAAKAPLADAALTGAPTAPTPASGTNSTRIATTAFVLTELADLADSAPDTLNTLNELAAALGDDPNFATTITTLLAAKAPLASPALTGAIGLNGSVTGNLVAVAGGVLNCAQGNNFTDTVDAATDFTLSNVPAGCAYSFCLTMTYTAGALTWPASFDWGEDGEPSWEAGRWKVIGDTVDGGVTVDVVAIGPR